MSCLNVWDRVLSPREADLTLRKCGQGGNVLDWSREAWTIHGSVSLTDNQCDAFRSPSMSASSQYNNTEGPDNGVLDSPLSGGWVPRTPDQREWLMVDLHKTYFVTAIITQGRDEQFSGHIVTSYSITYGEHSGDEVTYSDDDGLTVTFPGNTDRNTPVRNELSSYSGAITARYVKFHPLTWRDWPSMRAGVVAHSALEPVGRWPLNEQDGARDVTGNGNDGIASGSQVVEGPGGPESQAFLFNGSSHIRILNDGGLDVRFSYTILAHVYMDPTVASGPLFEYDYQGDFNRGVAIRREGSADSSSTTSPPLATNRWHYVGGSYDYSTGEQAVWVDSVKAGSKNYTMAAELATQHDVSVGYQEYAGRISCLQLFDFSLNEHQIAIVREACEETCPYGWYLSGYVCYRAFDEPVSWHTANTRCGREGGRLATVKDTDTHNFIVPLKNSVDPDEEFWIGLSDLGATGTWVWTDGTSIGQFTAWGGNQPNYHEGDQFCASYWLHNSMNMPDRWNDANCIRPKKFICERVNGQPKYLTCSSERTDGFSLRWKYPSAHLSGCHIWYQDVLDGVEPMDFVTSRKSGNEYANVTINGLKSGTKYNVTVRAIVGTTESLDDVINVLCITGRF
ncbi:uncharacterized protein LOC118422202 [Branchiostoma floridae]|uniref:Uncharacterized protein LOC118422202 n=2 Tax=Branchiostoma floridae TaxID=7739 RepID=A0A9J7N0G2_BRAFL|nr:uncharacterized protein LOC118422202 [Branchiostoma floridae]